MNETEDCDLSLGGNVWNVAQTDERRTEQMCRRLEISSSMAKLLILRGITEDNAPLFLNPKLSTSMPDPSVLKDMDKAAARIAEAIINHQKIGIIGDYDVDGATSTSVLRLFLTYLGIETAVHIPEREEGYGPSTLAFQEFADFGADLVITVDCGTSAFEVLDTKLSFWITTKPKPAYRRSMPLSIPNAWMKTTTIPIWPIWQPSASSL